MKAPSCIHAFHFNVVYSEFCKLSSDVFITIAKIITITVKKFKQTFGILSERVDKNPHIVYCCEGLLLNWKGMFGDARIMPLGKLFSDEGSFQNAKCFIAKLEPSLLNKQSF